MAKKEHKIRARLTVYGHGEMSQKELKQFKWFVSELIPKLAQDKQGELSNVFRQTLYKE